MANQWVLFDFDGVIADTETISLASWRSLLRDPSQVSISDICGNTAVENAARLAPLLREPAATADIVSRKLDLDHQHIAQFGIDLVPNADLFITAAATRYRLAIVSSSPADAIGKFLVGHRLDRFFEFICSPCEGCARKPAPDLYLSALRRAQAISADVVAIEDSPTGVRSALSASVRVLGFGEAASGLSGMIGLIRSFGDVSDALSRVDMAFRNGAHR